MTFEKWAEQDLKKMAKQLGGHAYKFTSPGENGLPDRMITVPPNIVWFVELKSEGKQPSVLQDIQMTRLEKRGAKVCWINSEEALYKFYRVIREEQIKVRMDEI